MSFSYTSKSGGRTSWSRSPSFWRRIYLLIQNGFCWSRSEEVIRPGEGEYSQWNIPSRETGPGFMAQDYAQAQPGTTDWMRQIYPWARNLPENVLQRAIQDGDYLRMLMQKAEAGELLPMM